MLTLLIDRIATPLGAFALVADEEGRLHAAEWTDCMDRIERSLRLLHGADGYTLKNARNPGGHSAALRAYFSGDIAAIDKLPVAKIGTEFQQLMWRNLRKLPAGKTMAYSDFASRIGKPAAIRAVGAANGANPISVVVPCHRLIGANGSLTKYGGGLHRKQWLLEHEQSRLSTA
ncbi:MAG TPA: methylated-DNA--[protein]-cysteine S-methyltransferase [Dongiaceae bacterium]|nr:methylated-DNA--[protein]-cysteine S-methyltransferase [Dongiaceae bacterium]